MRLSAKTNLKISTGFNIVARDMVAKSGQILYSSAFSLSYSPYRFMAHGFFMVDECRWKELLFQDAIIASHLSRHPESVRFDRRKLH